LETSGESWVIDGDYSDVRDIVWSRADTLVWLDLPFLTIFYRILWRTLRRVVTREKLWNNNVERLDKSEYSHLNIFRFKTEFEIQEWLDLLKFALRENY